MRFCQSLFASDCGDVTANDPFFWGSNNCHAQIELAQPLWRMTREESQETMREALGISFDIKEMATNLPVWKRVFVRWSKQLLSQ